MKKTIKENFINILISGAIVLLLVVSAVLIVNYKPKPTMKEIKVIETDSKIVSDDPQTTASLFTKANGTMGSLSEATTESLKTGELVFNNGERRKSAFIEVSKAIVPGSPLITDLELKNIERHINNIDVAVIFLAENIKVGKPANERRLSVSSEEEGLNEYDAVDVLVSFDSIKTTFMSAKDSSFDGTYTQVDNRETFNEVKITLVRSGELWFVYDIEDAEYLLNERFATWSGIGPITTNFENNETVGTIKVPGVEPAY